MLSLFIIRRTVGFGTCSFAFCDFFVPFLPFFIGPGACRPVAFKPV
jgi:hypothetical protein